MSHHHGATSSGTMAVRFAAVATVGVAVAADLLAGERPLHTATLALVAVVVGQVRMWRELPSQRQETTRRWDGPDA
jgi:hypothetical protein